MESYNKSFIYDSLHKKRMKQMKFLWKEKRSNKFTKENTIDLSSNNTLLPSHFDQITESIISPISSDDLKVIHIKPLKLSYIYLDTIVDSTRLHDEVVSQFKQLAEKPLDWEVLFPNGTMHQQLEKVLVDLMQGHVIIIHQAWQGQAISISLTDFQMRAVEQPHLEAPLLGPKDGFNENLNTNISLLRHFNKDVNLTITYFTVGERSRNRVALVYYRDIVNPEWVEEIEENIKKIYIDRIIGHKTLMELIIGRNQTVFPLYEMTEAPARTTHFLNEGRIAILLDGSPFASLLPTVLVNMFFAGEYLTQGNIISLFVRSLRVTAAFLALFSPALYVALVAVNTGIVPTELGIMIASNRASIPYPVVIEVLVLFIILDIFIESTSFAPGPLGSALNIVGSLIIGQAAAEAGFVSLESIIIAAITAIGTFLTMFQFTYALRIWKYPLILVAAPFGIFGIICCAIVIAGHLCKLKSLGVPYMSPLAPLRLNDFFNELLPYKDVSEKKERPKMWKTIDKKRQEGDADE